MTSETPIITITNYVLWTGESAPQYSDAEWVKLTNAAASRLMSFLCINELPEDLPDELEELLANFIASVIARSGSKGEVESKIVRNFHINFRAKSAANAFAEIGQEYGDIIEKYSQCGSGISVEKNARYHCGCDSL